MISAKKKKNKNAKEKLCMKNKAEIDNYRMSLGEKKTNAKEKKKLMIYLSKESKRN